MFRDDRLDPRKKHILQAIIEEYILTAEPIGSRTIARRSDIGLSPATIRNEMADLEEMGYLYQPHTSSGRIPSHRGYRLYVDELVKYCELTKAEMQKMKDLLDVRMNDIDELIKLASKLVSEITEYTSIGVTSKNKNISIKTVQILPLKVGSALVILVLDGGKVESTIVTIDEDMDEGQINVISNYLNSYFTGKIIDKVNIFDIPDTEIEFNIPYKDVKPFLEGIVKCVNNIDAAIYMDGAINIFNQPEFQDVIRAKEFLKILHEKDKILEILTEVALDGGIHVRIGKENIIDELKDCSVITATYSIDGEVLGSINIVGPTRMKYGKVLTSIEHASRNLNRQIRRLTGNTDDRR